MTARRGALLLLVALASPGAAQAPAPAYRRAPRDTLRYQEQTTARIDIAMAEPVSMQTFHDATLAIVFGGADTARAWFETLSVSLSARGGTQRPSTDSLRGAPYLLSFPASGMVATLEPPPIPREVANQTDLTREFDDFFISLPARPLRAGLTWSDSLSHERPARPGDTYRSDRVRRYQVLRDTTVAGERAVIIGIEQFISTAATSPVPGGVARAGTILEGHESGTAIFAVRSGRMLERRRSGTLNGRFSMMTPNQSRDFEQRYEYTSVITLQR